jgi:hypothetical protein
LHLRAILELPFVFIERSYTIKMRFLGCFVHFPCVNNFHVCGLLNVSTINMDVFKLLDSYAYDFHVIRSIIWLSMSLKSLY